MQRLIKKLLEDKTLAILAIAYTLFISIGLLMPSQGLLPSTSELPVDKLFHAVLNCLLIVLWLSFVYAKENKMITAVSIYTVFGLCLVYGIVIEVLQGVFTTYRQADYLDVLANLVGLLIGVGLFRRFKDKIFNLS